MNCLIYPSILSKGTESQRIEKTSTENGFLVSLEALCFIELVSELLFFISPFYFFSGMSLPSSSVQLLSRVWLFVTLWTTARRASLSITNSQSLPKLMSIELVMPSNHLILCHPLLLLPPIPPSITVFSNESTLHMRWPKYWSFSFSIIPSNEHPGLVSFRMDWLDLLAVQGTLKSLLQHHSSKASILWHSAFFMVQLSHPYMTTGKTIALTRWAFVRIFVHPLKNNKTRTNQPKPCFCLFPYEILPSTGQTGKAPVSTLLFYLYWNLWGPLSKCLVQ